MQDHLEILQRCPLFRDISGAELLRLLPMLQPKINPYPKADVILQEGSPAGVLCIVLAGTAQIERTDYNGNRSILSKVGPGEILGEAFACSDAKTLPVRVIAAEDCTVMLISVHRILEQPDISHTVMRNLLRVVANKNLILNRKIQVISKRTTREKLLTYLNEESFRAKSRSFTIPYNRQELADYLEVERSGLSAEIGKLQKENVLRSHKSQFTLLQ